MEPDPSGTSNVSSKPADDTKILSESVLGNKEKTTSNSDKPLTKVESIEDSKNAKTSLNPPTRARATEMASTNTRRAPVRGRFVDNQPPNVYSSVMDAYTTSMLQDDRLLEENTNETARSSSSSNSDSRSQTSVAPLRFPLDTDSDEDPFYDAVSFARRPSAPFTPTTARNFQYFEEEFNLMQIRNERDHERVRLLLLEFFIFMCFVLMGVGVSSLFSFFTSR